MTMRAVDLVPLPRPGSPTCRLAPILALALVLPFVLVACDSADPGSGAVDVLQEDASQDTPEEEIRGGGGTFPENATEAQVLALEEVNRFRVASGLPVVNEVASLNQSSQAHAEFLVSNCSNYGTAGLSPHNENASWPGFTGVQFWDRMNAAGYPKYNVGMSEVIAFLNDPGLAVKGWVRTLYHRLPLLDPRTKEIGYGGANIGDGPYCNYQMLWNADVIDIGMNLDAEDVVVLYPPDGAKYVPTSFDGMESPTPIKPYSGWPSGTIITVQFGKNLPFTVTGHRLLEFGETEVPHLFVAATEDVAASVVADPNLDPSHDEPYRVLALYGLSRLKAGTDYTVVIDLVRDGSPVHLEWTFKTNFKQD